MRRPAYLDYNATAPMRPAVREAVIDALAIVGNPSSIHRFGRDARRVVERARLAVAEMVGATPSQVIFTSGATEANNWAVTATPRARRLVSAIEHDSVLESAESAEIVPVSAGGVVDLAALDRRLAGARDSAIVSVMAVNNETGVIQPVAEAAAIAHRHGALFHCDAVQAAGRLPVDVDAWEVDLLSLSAHKLGGPHGIGALVVSADLEIGRLLKGGGQEMRRRGGTENVAGIAGFGAAAAAVEESLADQARLEALREGLEHRILRDCPSAIVFGRESARVANTTCLAMPGMPAETQLIAFDLAGIAVSAGAACSSGKVRRSHVLTAMGVDDPMAGSAIRVSLGWHSTAADVDRLVEAWLALYRRAGRATAVVPEPLVGGPPSRGPVFAQGGEGPARSF